MSEIEVLIRYDRFNNINYSKTDPLDTSLIDEIFLTLVEIKNPVLGIQQNVSQKL